MPQKTVKTVWELWEYDVLGNREDGFDVNNQSCFDRAYKINLEIIVNNPGSNMQFKSAYPTDKQIKDAFGVGCKLDLSGDDLTIYVNRESDGFPIGEMNCVSHSSLSPIRQ